MANRVEAIFPNSDKPFSPGMSADFKLAITNNPANTGAIPVFGKPIGRIRNESTINVTLAFYDAHSINSTELTCYDEDNAVQSTAYSLSGLSSRKFPYGLEGCNILIPILTSGSTSLNLFFHLER